MARGGASCEAAAPRSASGAALHCAYNAFRLKYGVSFYDSLVCWMTDILRIDSHTSRAETLAAACLFGIISRILASSVSGSAAALIEHLSSIAYKQISMEEGTLRAE